MKGKAYHNNHTFHWVCHGSPPYEQKLMLPTRL